MTIDSPIITDKTPKYFSPIAGSFFLLMFVVVSLVLILQYAESERQRDLMNWQSRLALLAEIHVSDIERFITVKTGELNELAGNPSLRLFLSELSSDQLMDASVLQAQQGYIRNLVIASADRFGVKTKDTLVQAMPVEVPYGLAIVNDKQALLMSTKGFPVKQGEYEKVLVDVFNKGEMKIIDLYKGYNQQAVFGLVVPVFHIQNGQQDAPVGAIILLINPENNIYQLLKNKQSSTKTDESLLVRKRETSLQFISPLQQGHHIFHELADNDQYASGYAYKNHGGFTQLKDYRGVDVLVTGRRIKDTGWVLVQKINAAEALVESNRHQRFLLTSFSILVLFVAASFIAIWRHGISVKLKKLSDDLVTHMALLDAVGENIQENILLIDDMGKIIFMNPAFQSLFSISEKLNSGTHIHDILGEKMASELDKCLSDEKKLCIKQIDISGVTKTFHVTVSSPATGQYASAKLFVLHDISELKQEQERREQLGKGIISTLVKAVDLHDPYCANHSERTRQVAVEIGREMGLSGERLETLEMAALLANIGKLLIPREILTKMDSLSDGEAMELRKHIDYALEILSDLSFNGPVLEIISQKNERQDGSGYPRGLTSSQILLESNILAVANAFVAMASSRAYREGRTVNDAVDLLLEKVDTLYDRHVVAALFHIAENKSDWHSWRSVAGEGEASD